jgi:hypothetical protein
MNRKLVFQGRLTEDDWVAMHIWMHKARSSRVVYWIALVFFSGLIALLTFVAIEGLIEAYYPLVAVLLMVVTLLFPAYKRTMLRNQYRANESMILECTVELSSDSIGISNDLSSSTLSWDVIGMVFDTPDGLIFTFKTGLILFFLPQRVLDSEGIAEEVLSLASSCRVPIRELN